MSLPSMSITSSPMCPDHDVSNACYVVPRKQVFPNVYSTPQSEISQFENKCSIWQSISSMGWVECILAGIAYCEATNLYFFLTKWNRILKLGEKHIIDGMYLTPNHVFWAIIHENWLLDLGCTLGKESKKHKKVTVIVHVTNMWIIIWSKPKCASLVITSKKVKSIG
jgi:hypothetical protein